MLMALLYSGNDQIVAAAPACDQVPMGDQFWFEVHAAEIVPSDVFETAYVMVENRKLCEQLLLIGIDQSVDGIELTRGLSGTTTQVYSPKAA